MEVTRATSFFTSCDSERSNSVFADTFECFVSLYSFQLGTKHSSVRVSTVVSLPNIWMTFFCFYPFGKPSVQFQDPSRQISNAAFYVQSGKTYCAAFQDEILAFFFSKLEPGTWRAAKTGVLFFYVFFRFEIFYSSFITCEQAHVEIQACAA